MLLRAEKPEDLDAIAAINNVERLLGHARYATGG